MGCIELSGGFHTAQRQTSTQIPIGFCVNLLVPVSVLISVSVSVSGSVKVPYYTRVFYLNQVCNFIDLIDHRPSILRTLGERPLQFPQVQCARKYGVILWVTPLALVSYSGEFCALDNMGPFYGLHPWDWYLTQVSFAS